MKTKLLLTLMLSICLKTVFTQNKPNKNFFGLGIEYKLNKDIYNISYYDYFSESPYRYNLQSKNYFPNFKFDWYFKDNVSLNVSYLPSFINRFSRNENITSNVSKSEIRTEFFSSNIGIGVERHFLNKLKIDPFLGLNIHYIYNSPQISKSSYENKNTYQYYKYKTSTKTISVASHGMQLKLNIGMNYFLSKNFSVGINIDAGEKFNFQEGKTITETNVKGFDQNDKEIFSRNIKNEIEVNNAEMGFIYSFSIKSSFYFSAFKPKVKS